MKNDTSSNLNVRAQVIVGIQGRRFGESRSLSSPSEWV
jgi:hypothetical protein